MFSVSVISHIPMTHCEWGREFDKVSTGNRESGLTAVMSKVRKAKSKENQKTPPLRVREMAQENL